MLGMPPNLVRDSEPPVIRLVAFRHVLDSNGKSIRAIECAHRHAADYNVAVWRYEVRSDIIEGRLDFDSFGGTEEISFVKHGGKDCLLVDRPKLWEKYHKCVPSCETTVFRGLFHGGLIIPIEWYFCKKPAEKL